MPQIQWQIMITEQYLNRLVLLSVENHNEILNMPNNQLEELAKNYEVLVVNRDENFIKILRKGLNRLDKLIEDKDFINSFEKTRKSKLLELINVKENNKLIDFYKEIIFLQKFEILAKKIIENKKIAKEYLINNDFTQVITEIGSIKIIDVKGSIKEEFNFNKFLEENKEFYEKNKELFEKYIEKKERKATNQMRFVNKE